MRFSRFVLIAFLLVGNLAGCTAERSSRRGSPPQPGVAQPPGAAPAAPAAATGDGSYTIQGKKEYYVRVLGN